MAATRPVHLASKLTRMNLLVSGIALLLACGAFAAYDYMTFRAATVRSLSIQAQMAGSNSVSALVFDEPGAAEETLSSLKAAPDVISAQIYRPDGELFASYWKDGVSGSASLRPLPPGQIEDYVFTLDTVSLERRIDFSGDTVGVISIQSTLRPLYQRVGRYLLIVGSVMVASLLMVLVVSRVAQRSVSGPLVALADLASRVADEKDYSIRAADHRGAPSEVATLITAFNGMLERLQSRDRELQHSRDELEERVRLRTAELKSTNEELEAFSYSVSHDLRAPLRHIVGFANLLQRHAAEQLDDRARRHVSTMVEAATKMGQLIDDLLSFSRMGRASLSPRRVDLSELVTQARAEVMQDAGGRTIHWHIQRLPEVDADPALLRPALVNLLANAVKYTSTREAAHIEVGAVRSPDGETIVFVRDNGVGFDMRYANKLFGVFQRLHRADEFSGTGIGLANVRRIIHRHGGRTWAEAAIDQGATFYFSLPASPRAAAEHTAA